MKHLNQRPVCAAATVAAILICGAPDICRAEVTSPSPPNASALTNDLPRDPFWPMGYVPRVVKQSTADKLQTEQEQAQAQALVQWPSLALAGITQTDGRNIGLIKGVGLVENGDIVRVSRDGVVYKWRIMSVSEDGLSYQKLSATPIPLKSTGTGERKD